MSWVGDRLGLGLYGTASATGVGADELLGLALRRNPRRAHLLVSRVLGKHIPTDPRLVRAAGTLLGLLVADALTGRGTDLPDGTGALLRAAVDGDRAAAAGLQTLAAGLAGEPVHALVLGYAETATALGHCVADALAGADYLHSTRRQEPGAATAGGFEEEHSHAPGHHLLPADPALLAGDRPLVLVDDELSTGATMVNTITALHRTAPRERYVAATLVDVRDAASAAVLTAVVAALGARVDVVSLAAATLQLPTDVAARAATLRADGRDPCAGIVAGATIPAHGSLDLHRAGWPAGLPVGGRHGWSPAHRARLDAVLPALGAAVRRAAGLARGERVLVLGTEELMYLPLRLAQTLADSAPAHVSFSTTTRSPAVVVAAPGYALTSGVTFAAHDHPADGPGPRFAYNLGGAPWDVMIPVVDAAADTPALHARDGLLAALAPHARRILLVVTP